MFAEHGWFSTALKVLWRNCFGATAWDDFFSGGCLAQLLWSNCLGATSLVVLGSDFGSFGSSTGWFYCYQLELLGWSHLVGANWLEPLGWSQSLWTMVIGLWTMVYACSGGAVLLLCAMAMAMAVFYLLVLFQL